MSIASDLVAAAAQIQADAAILHAWISGPAAGDASIVDTPGGPVKTLARIVAEASGATTDFGYEQITPLTSAQALTAPYGATRAWVVPGNQGVRFRADGTDPTATVGFPLAPGQPLEITGDLSAYKFIQQSSGAYLDVWYFQ